MNIITSSGGKEGNQKVETSSDQIDNNGGEDQDQDQLDDMKLFDSS